MLGGRIGVLEATIHTNSKGISEVKLNALSECFLWFLEPQITGGFGINNHIDVRGYGVDTRCRVGGGQRSPGQHRNVEEIEIISVNVL